MSKLLHEQRSLWWDQDPDSIAVSFLNLHGATQGWSLRISACKNKCLQKILTSEISSGHHIKKKR
jgi:hypothetical protein